MKKLAIIFGLLMFAPAAFAGGTTIYMDTPGSVYPQQQQFDPNNTYYTTDGVYGDQGQKVSGKKVRKVRVGGQKNDPNVYWNFGAVNFGSGFTTTGGGDRKY